MTKARTLLSGPVGRVLPWLAVGGWYGVIWWFSAQTGAESGGMSNQLVLWSLGLDWDVSEAELEAARAELLSVLFRKGAHMGAFFLLTALLTWALWRYVKRPGVRYGLAVGLCTALAALDEYHQTFVPGRSGQVRDVAVDLAGALLFVAFWCLARHVWKRRNSKKIQERDTLLS